GAAAANGGRGHEVALDCTTAEQRVVYVLPLDADLLTLPVQVSGPGWLEIEENGQKIDLIGEHAGSIQVLVPLRFGRRFVPVENDERLSIRRLSPGRASGAVAATLHCGSTSNLQTQLEWFRRASAISERLKAPVIDNGFDSLMASLAALHDSAPDAKARAL